MRKTLCIGFVMLGFALTACDDDDDKQNKADPGVDARAPGTRGINLGLDKNKPINQLTDAERNQACRELQAWSEDFTKEITPKVCRLVGALSVFQGETPSPTSCEQSVSACLVASMTDAGAGPDTNDMCGAAQADCSATVGEVEKCTNDNLTVVNMFLDALPTCAQLAKGTGTLPLGIPTDPTSCTSIKPKCPQLPLLSDLLQASLLGRQDNP